MPATKGVSGASLTTSKEIQSDVQPDGYSPKLGEVAPAKFALPAADVDEGASSGIRLGLAQDLVRNRCGIPLPEE
jgi:hypothetical protein